MSMNKAEREKLPKAMGKKRLDDLRKGDIYALAALTPPAQPWGTPLSPHDLQAIIAPFLDHIDALEGQIEELRNLDVPDSLSLYFMHDGHWFTKLEGNTVDEMLEHADAIESSEDGSYGSLCPISLMRGKREIRTVGQMVHSRGSSDSKDMWNKGKAAWKAVVMADTDVQRILGAAIASASEAPIDAQ
jgi:hypothetical protein